MLPDFSIEKIYWKKGYTVVCGIDEVGRGSLAGPLLASCCLLKPEIEIKKLVTFIKDIMALGIDDCKRVKPAKRAIIAKKMQKYFIWEIGQSTVSEINSIGIVKATYKAMRRAFYNFQFSIFNFQKDINKKNIFLLIDGFRVPRIDGVRKIQQLGIIDGDRKSISIAAASIAAKVTRDSIMSNMAKYFPNYAFERNKGYGTREHVRALKKYGPSKIHRRLFVDSLI